MGLHAMQDGCHYLFRGSSMRGSTLGSLSGSGALCEISYPISIMLLLLNYSTASAGIRYLALGRQKRSWAMAAPETPQPDIEWGKN